MRGEIRFIFGETETVLSDVSPTTTVLEWLRVHARALGTKEGCAEGDCGACTVLLGEPDGEGVRYRPVNACLLFVPALDGRQFLTVEHLRGPDGAPHPVQAAMVAHHASQCGFCTPGIVMSLVALGHASPEADRAEVCEALAGNLCRCTGYRPIVDAARAAHADTAHDRIATAAPAMAARLRALPQDGCVLAHGGQTYWSPRTLDDAAALAEAHPQAMLLAGGTDAALLVTKARKALPALLALDRVAGLGDISRDGAHLSLGAAVAYEDALPALEDAWPEFGAMLRRLGSRQIRHRGTVGGNLGTASPIGDMPPALIALDASIRVRTGADTLAIPVAEFFTGYRRHRCPPGSLIESVAIPLPEPDDLVRVYKVSKRREEDISSVCAAFRLRLDGGLVRDLRAGFGGMAATPVRAVALERAVIGQPWTRATVEAGMRALDATLHPLSDMRASAAYRATVAKNLLLRLWLETSGQDVRTRIAMAA